MSPLTLTILISSFLLLDAMVVAAVFSLGAAELKSLAADFPAREPQIHAERRNFQSFSLGLMNFGWCFHVIADRDHVHMLPALLFRKLGVPNFSLPRAELKDPRQCLGGVQVTLRGRDLKGPRWCLAPDML
ncbi:MAG: hypothetical protein JSS51_11695 [Planctomycetes bacterium]|nr:hypothetical protein [Planctomycetota bacterium]